MIDLTNYFNKFRNGFQGQLPDAPLEFANLAHSSDASERMIYLNSVYVEQNWNKLIDKLNASIVNDSDIDKVDWQTKILDAISELNGVSEQDVRPTVNNVIRLLRDDSELTNLFDAQDDDYSDAIKDKLLNEFLPTFVQFLEQGIITDMDLGKYSERIRNPKDVNDLRTLKKQIMQLRNEIELREQDVTKQLKPIVQIEYGGFVSESQARELGYVNYIYIVRGRSCQQ